MPNLYIGTSGYTYGDWRGIFYPKGVAQKNWLSFYAEQYNAVEINATFYRLFAEKVVAHWRDVTPDEFCFVLKAPKVITHEKVLEAVNGELQQFITSAAVLEHKLAAVLWQFPPSFRKDAMGERFAKFLPELPTTISHVFEFRHLSWFSEDIYALLNQFHAGMVVNDSPRLPSQFGKTDSMLYIRFHGPGKLYDSTYSSEQMREWSGKIIPYLGKDNVYLFFNNTMRGQALANANELHELLTGR